MSQTVSTDSSYSIAVVGGGIAGLFCAWRLARAGQQVSLLEKGQCGREASWMAAGMLAPVNELEFNELDLLKMGVASREMYQEVEQELGEIGLIREGTLEVGIHPDDSDWLRRLYEYQVAQGLRVEWLQGSEMRDLEPFLSRQVQQGIWSPDDVQVDNRLLCQRLLAACVAMGVKIREQSPVEGYEASGENEVKLKIGGQEESFAKVVFTTGVGNPGGALPYKIYPVRGELIVLEMPQGDFLRKTIRIRNRILGNAYVVPKAKRIVLGSTAEEQGYQSHTTAGGLLDILRKTYAAVPGLYELKVLETNAGLRPSTLNRQPIIDKEPKGEVYHLNGLYRHGILLSPLASLAMVKLMLERERMELVEPFYLPQKAL